MDDQIILDKPLLLPDIEAKSKEIGFMMPSDLSIGSLLRTLITSKPKANILELGTGVGLSLCWMIDGLDANSKLISIDNDLELSAIARQYFGADPRIEIICTDGGHWLKQYRGDSFDLIFADAWPGKYTEIEEVLKLVKLGGFYVIDDMLTQPNWPEGHQKKVDGLVDYLEQRDDFSLTKMIWSTGLIVATRSKRGSL